MGSITKYSILFAGTFVDVRGPRESALAFASAKGHVRVVKLLLANGADIDAEIRRGTAVVMASAEGYIQIVELLLNNRPQAAYLWASAL